MLINTFLEKVSSGLQVLHHEKISLVKKTLNIGKVFRNGDAIHEVYGTRKNLRRTVDHLNLRFELGIPHASCEGRREIFGPVESHNMRWRYRVLFTTHK